MQLKDLSKKTILIAVFTGLVALSPVLVFSFVQEITIQHTLGSFIENIIICSTPEPVSLVSYGLSVIQAGKPTHLIIPSINVDSAVEYVGLDSDGAMDVPKNRYNVGWFEIGPRPGENGSAVIAGHYGRKDGKGSAFDDLHKLRKGNKVYIKDDKGVFVSFVVQGSQRYDSKANASGVFSSDDGKSHLNLITCEGVWDEAIKQYSKRLVVFTDRE